MTDFVCNYAAVRFLPYRETSEFVNVGVVVYCPEIDYFDFKISKRRQARIKHFFPELDNAVFSDAIEVMRYDLQRRRNTGLLFTPVGAGDVARQRADDFRHFVRRKESLLHFSDVGMVMTSDPLQAVRTLYARFVERDFAQPKQYQELVMQRRLGEWLKEWDLRARYAVNEQVGGGEFHVRLPFIHRQGGRVVKALKPLDLAKKDTTSIYEHGDAWVSRMRRLKEMSHLPDQMIFTVNLPPFQAQQKAADEIRQDLEDLEIVVVPFAERDRIRELARV